MSGSILIARATATSAGVARPTLAQRLFRQGALARLRTLRSGAIALRDAFGEERVGDASGPLGTVELDVHDPATWVALGLGGDVGAGEAFVAGQWSCSDLVRLLSMFVRDRDVMVDLHETPWSLPRRLLLRFGQLLRRNSRHGSAANIHDHYDLGDDLFARFLDPSMTYSAAWFEQHLALYERMIVRPRILLRETG